MSMSDDGNRGKRRIKKKKAALDQEAYSEVDQKSDDGVKSEEKNRGQKNSDAASFQNSIITSERFARTLTKLIQTELINAANNVDSETSSTSRTTNSDSVVELPRGKSLSTISTNVVRADSPLRHSNETPRLIKTAMLNSSPRREVAFATAPVIVATVAASSPPSLTTAATSSTTRSTDSSPRNAVGSADSSPFGSPRANWSSRGSSNRSTPAVAVASTTSRSLLQMFNRRTASSRQKTVVTTKQFLANDFLVNNNTVAHLSLEDFEWLQCIGGGGAGKVYLTSKKGAMFAVKIYNDHYSLDEEDADRKKVLQQLQLIGSLDHPNILQMFGYRFEPHNGNSRLIVVMPYVSNSLEGLVKRRRELYYHKSCEVTSTTILKKPPFRITEIVGLFEQIVDAVAYLHRSGIIHRDVKCENVLAFRCDYKGGIHQVLDETMTPRDKSGEVSKNKNDDDDDGDESRYEFGTELHSYYKLLLSDFDTVKKQESFSSSSSSSSSKSSNDLLRTTKQRNTLNVTSLGFSAPEMLNDPFYDDRVDVWSLGIILYNLLMLESPYDIEQYGFELSKIITAGIRPKILDGYINTPEWQEIKQILFDCTEKNPKDRLDSTILSSRLANIKNCQK